MKAILTLLATLAFVLSPYFSSGFGGFNPDQYPIPQVDPPVQPEGYAFSIWGVIYVWLVFSALYGLWKHRIDPAWDAARLPLILSLAPGAFWIEVATRSPIWATVLIWIMLATAIWAVFAAQKATPNWALTLPLGLYAGWLSAASLVSIGLLGAGYGIGFDGTGWAIIMLVIALAALGYVQRKLPGTWTYGLAGTWALVAIAVQNIQGPAMVLALAIIAAIATAFLTWTSRSDTPTA